ncbi:MAG: ECF-type sigma factor [Bacteroidia bacterium]
MSATNDLTLLLQAARHGNAQAYDQVFSLVYSQLRQLAHRLRWEQGQQETLNTTALVHEAYLRLAAGTTLEWESRAHFMGVAAKAMRFLLINYARHKQAQKRGGKNAPMPIEEVHDNLQLSGHQEESLIDLNQALDTLSEYDSRQAQIIECRFFGGMTIEDTAMHLSLSPATVKREWTMAKAWLHRQLNQ